jgi:hypothetical protein
MPRVGLLAEHVYRAGSPIFLGAAHPDAWPGLCVRFAHEGVDFLAVELRPTDAEGGIVIYASAPFACRPAPALARLFNLRGQSARQLPATEGAGGIMGAGHCDGKLTISDGWSKHVLEE